jgi:hypothetical protein
MTFQDARDLAIEFGAKLPRYDHTANIAQCWIDRVQYLPFCEPAQLAAQIEHCNRYA